MLKLQNLTKLFVDAKQVITEADVDFYQAHPEELELIIDKEVLHLSFLTYFFLVGLLIMVASRIVIYLFADVLNSFVAEVILEISFEMGNALLGGVIAAFLLEYLQKKQYQENVRYRQEVLRRIAQRSKTA
ncbi:MAG: hypothetical protein AAF267_22720 [Deinococcota bacterium]